MNQDIQFPEVQEDVISWGRRSRTYCPNYKAIVNPETGDTFSIVSQNYKLLKHEEALEVVLEAVDKNEEFGRYEVNTELLKNGSRMVTEIVFPDVDFDVGNGDLVNPKIDIKNSYDTGWQYEVHFAALRQICANGLTMGEQFAFYIKRHTQALNTEIVQQILIKGMQEFSKQTDLWKTWMDRNTTSLDYEQAMKTLDLSKRDTEAIHREVEIASDVMLDDIRIKTLKYWYFYNIITQYITHNINSRIRQENLRSILRRTFK
jgi:hypothetical protein